MFTPNLSKVELGGIHWNEVFPAVLQTVTFEKCCHYILIIVMYNKLIQQKLYTTTMQHQSTFYENLVSVHVDPLMRRLFRWGTRRVPNLNS